MKRLIQFDSGNAKGVKGRGAVSNPNNRYESQHKEAFNDGWGVLDEEPQPLKTTLEVDSSKTVITYNDSPDVPFDRSINPYRGCEHGCIYCYARPTHAWLGHSPGLDFESRLYHKPDAVEQLRLELSKPGYRCAPIALGGITDAYQPVEQRLGLTRRIIELLKACGHPLTIVTKSALVERDLDLLQEMARVRQVQVIISLTTLQRELARHLEPRAATPQRRLETLRRLSDAGVPAGILIAPLIPVLTDPELETIMQVAREQGASSVRYILLRLPQEVAPLFSEWLETHVPGQAQRVLERIRDTRDGKLYRSDFNSRMSGTGAYADLLTQRFQLGWKRLSYREFDELDCSRFAKPAQDSRQMNLF